MNKKPRVLFLCIENRARSQMAEALLRKHAGDQFEIYSAGFEPTPIHPHVYRVMEEVGLDLEGQYAKGVVEFFNKVYFGILITVCQKAEEKCPTFPGLGERRHWPIPDPAAVEGSEEEKLEAFRAARDKIEQHILDWLARREALVRRQEGHDE
jgi:arsenate reductase